MAGDNQDNIPDPSKHTFTTGPRHCSPKSIETINKIRALLKEHGVTEVARRVGKSTGYVKQVKLGLRPRKAKETFTMAHLQLKYSNKLCRTCGQVAGIIAKSRRCIKCELRELAKSGVIIIVSEDDLEEEFESQSMAG